MLRHWNLVVTTTLFTQIASSRPSRKPESGRVVRNAEEKSARGCRELRFARRRPLFAASYGCPRSSLMHSIQNRVSSVITFAISVLACLTLLLALSSLRNYKAAPIVSLFRASEVRVDKAKEFSFERSSKDLGIITTNIEAGKKSSSASRRKGLNVADFSPLFDWNTKQIFVFLVAEYRTQQNVLLQISSFLPCLIVFVQKFNQVVLWDEILLRHAKEKISFRNKKNEYRFFDAGASLKYGASRSLDFPNSFFS